MSHDREHDGQDGCCGGGDCGCGGGREEPKLWRSIAELEGAPELQDALENEFPRQAIPLQLGVDRRRFLQLMGGSLALGGAVACTRQPLETIVPYVKQPEQLVPGVPLFFATAAPTAGGYAMGVLAESHEGRPTKIEGNPEHPASLGATDVHAQASVLGLYDPDRSQTITNGGRIRTWEAFVEAVTVELANQEGGQGAGLRILTGVVTSPSVKTQMEAILKRFPAARWYQWQAVNDRNAVVASQAAFGRPLETRYDLAQADVVLTLDCDLLAEGPGSVRYAKDFSRGRRVWESGGKMNRLYAVESTPTCTGTIADHKLALAPAEVGAFALALAAQLGVGGATAPPGWSNAAAMALVQAAATDLQAARGRGVVAAGPCAPPEVHVLAHAINQQLGNLGTSVLVSEPIVARAADPLADLTALTTELKQGKVNALLILDANPVYDAPVDLDFAQALQSPAARLRVHWGLYDDETARFCHWHVPAAHHLECWGDGRAYDGTVTLQQPLIEPLYDGKPLHDVLAVLEGRPGTTAHQIVQAQWQAQLGGEPGWRKAVHDGLVPNTAAPHAGGGVNGGAVAAAAQAIGAAAAKPAQGLTVLFRPDPHVWDGRYANNAWLQELPRPHTKLVWDNPVLMSPKTARDLGVKGTFPFGQEKWHAEMVRVTIENRALDLAVWVLPGQADGVLTVFLGQGRERAGKVANGTGFATYKLRTSRDFWMAAGASAAPAAGSYELATTQGHFLMEGRPLVRQATLAEYQRNPGFVNEAEESPPEDDSLYAGAWKYNGHKWGMAINLSACTGCSACVVACQSENNIPVVGKEQVLRGREMHWLRIDQYYEGPIDAPVAVHNQPVPCMQCENAPCEVVCPVAATVHSDEGLNDMVYNRCVGTRYCSNNCPYKVRRFNFLLYSDWNTESLWGVRNPDVSVRSRGVMEKCTYCVQRINQARIDAKREDRRIRDGEIVPACGSACPADAIVFGDLNDPNSQINKLKKQERNYGVLEDLNTRPRTTYLAEIRNPNPELAPAPAAGQSTGH